MAKKNETITECPDGGKAYNFNNNKTIYSCCPKDQVVTQLAPETAKINGGIDVCCPKDQTPYVNVYNWGLNLGVGILIGFAEFDKKQTWASSLIKALPQPGACCPKGKKVIYFEEEGLSKIGGKAGLCCDQSDTEIAIINGVLQCHEVKKGK